MDALISWCRAQREMMLESIDALEAGRLHMGEIREGLKVDQSKAWAHTLRLRVAELDALISDSQPPPK
jgi:hypothetical protein